MADIDMDPFGGAECPAGREDGRTEEPTGEDIPLPLVPPVTPVGGGSTWEPEQGHEREQETSFGRTSQRTRLVKDYVKDLCKKLTENLGQTPEAIHYDYFNFRGGDLYYRE